MSLKVGDILPSFEAVTQNGKSFLSSNYAGKPLVIYFYPKDFTPGCTTQACKFRDFYQDFKDAGAEVIGISSDSEKSHQKFAVSHQLPFLLLADTDKKLQKLFGVPTQLFGLLPGRVTYVVNPQGKIVSIFNSFKAKGHIAHALELIKQM